MKTKQRASPVFFGQQQTLWYYLLRQLLIFIHGAIVALLRRGDVVNSCFSSFRSCACLQHSL